MSWLVFCSPPRLNGLVSRSFGLDQLSDGRLILTGGREFRICGGWRDWHDRHRRADRNDPTMRRQKTRGKDVIRSLGNRLGSKRVVSVS